MALNTTGKGILSTNTGSDVIDGLMATKSNTGATRRKAMPQNYRYTPNKSPRNRESISHAGPSEIPQRSTPYELSKNIPMSEASAQEFNGPEISIRSHQRTHRDPMDL